jgi:hypothetical protein
MSVCDGGDIPVLIATPGRRTKHNTFTAKHMRNDARVIFSLLMAIECEAEAKARKRKRAR